MSVIKLRRFNPDTDYGTIYKVYSDYNEQHSLFDIVSLNSPERFPTIFEKALSHNYKDFFMIEDAKSNSFVGFVISYSYSANDGHVKVMEYIDEHYRQCGYGGIAILTFLDMLFKHYNLRKVYTEVYSFNDASMNSHLAAGFEEEARLKEYRYYNDNYWDFIIYSVTRKRFYDKIGDTMKKLTYMVNKDEAMFKDSTL